MQRAELNLCIFGRDHEIRHIFLVAQEQILGVPAGDRAAARPRFLDRKYGRMSDGFVRYTEPIQIGEKRVRRGRHRPVNSAGG
jgi:hypothetical protein